jgi:hypothetical protein
MKGGADFNTAEHNTMDSGRVAEDDTKSVEFVCACLCSLCLTEPATHAPPLCRNLAAHKENKVDKDNLDDECFTDDKESLYADDEYDLDKYNDGEKDADEAADEDVLDAESVSSFLSDEEVKDAFALMGISRLERKKEAYEVMCGLADMYIELRDTAEHPIDDPRLAASDAAVLLLEDFECAPGIVNVLQTGITTLEATASAAQRATLKRKRIEYEVALEEIRAAQRRINYRRARLLPPRPRGCPGS